MNLPEKIELINCDPEDIGDAMEVVRDSFGIEYDQDALQNVKTFGEYCDVVVAALGLGHRDGCTTQQGFYKLRAAMANVLECDAAAIGPTTNMELLRPRAGRRRAVRELRRVLGARLGLLTMSRFTEAILLIGYLLSFVLLFITWRYGLEGVLACVVVMWVARRMANELTCETMGDAARLFVREHYRAARRDGRTVNRAEIVPLIKEIFAGSLFLEPEMLTADARV